MCPVFASASVVALAALASQNPPDFSGSWVLNRARSAGAKNVSATPRGEVTRTLVFDRRDPPSP